MTEWATTVQVCVEICTLLRIYGVKDKNVWEAYRQLPGQTQLLYIHHIALQAPGKAAYSHNAFS